MENNKSFESLEKEETQLIPLLRTCLRQFCANWIWFLLSVIVCVALGYLYQQRQSRVYQRQAVMLIEDADPTAGMRSSARRNSGSMSTLLELNGISVGDNLINEMFILTSCRLMERVVDTLQLDVDYTIRHNLHDVTLYRDRPFEIEFENNTKTAQSFKVRIEDSKTFTLYDFHVAPAKKGEEVDYENVEVRLHSNELKETPAGKLRIVTNAAIAEFPTEKVVSVTRLPKDVAAAVYASKVSATEYDKESSLIVLSCNDVNPDRAEDIVYQVYDAYKQDVVDNKNRVAYSTASFIDERIRLIGEDLSGVENQMADFKRSNQLISFEQNAQAYIAESTTARKQTIELETELAVTKYLTEFLQDQSKYFETIPVLSLPNATFSTLIAEYNKMMIDRNRLVSNSSESSPAVRDLDRQLASMRSSILSSVNSYVASVELQLKRARQNESAITGRLGSVPEQEKEGLDILRQQELKSALYTYLLNKREEVALQMAISEANVRLVEGPLGSNQPVSPRKSLILLISFVIGVLLPSAVLWLKMTLDVSISGRKDVEEATNIPIVGEVPHYVASNPEHAHPLLITDVEGDAPIMEAFRLVRYGLNFMRHSAKVFITTSASSGQGKSFISCNLANILGTTGKRVLLIDADIRKRDVSKAFGNSRGLTAILADDEDTLTLSDVVIPNGISENVDFLPAGKMPPNPSEMLMSDKLDTIIDMARAAYDYVVIDTTPTLVVADAGIVNRVADITLFVMRVGVQSKDFLPELENMYHAKKFRNLCIVVNDADLRDSGGYGYGYGYGYNHSGGRKQKKGPFWKKRKA